MANNVTNNSNTNGSSNGVNKVDNEIVNNEQMSITKELNGTENPQIHNDENVANNNNGANNLRVADGKRKKLKSRNIPTSTNSGYSKDHLNAWLETCLKDVSQEQLSSSSEFLDYNPKMITPTGSKVSKPKQQQTGNTVQSPSVIQSSYGHNMAGHNQQQYHQSSSHQQQMPQQNYHNIQNNSKSNLFTPGFPTGYSAQFSQSFQQSMPNFIKHSSNTTNRFSNMFSPSRAGYYGPLNDNSQDFASLPPIVNLLGNYGGNGGTGGGSFENENNSTDVLNGSGSNPNISRGFRFSDPCLLNPSDNDSKQSGQNTPDHHHRQNIPSEMENNKFFVALMEQINILHETNSKICRNLHETKVDIEALKHAPTWGMRHRRDSVSGLSAHSQPMIFGGGFGTNSPAPTYHSGAYTPGVMTDVVREVKEAARVREDAMLNRVKALVEERQWSMNEANLRMMRDIEELKSQINFLRSDRKESNKRITHLEAENKYMRQLLASIYNSNRNAPFISRDIIYENETQPSRKAHSHSNSNSHSQHSNSHSNSHGRRAQTLNLQYGTVHHQASSTVSLEEQDEEPLHIVEPPSMPKTNFAELKQQKQQQHLAAEMRNSFSSSDGSNCPITNDNINIKSFAMSPPNFALVSSPTPTATEQQPLQKPKRKNKENSLKKLSSEESLQQQQQVDKDLQQQQKEQEKRRESSESMKNSNTQEQLQRELNDAVTARQNADDRIIAIEKMVKNLHANVTSETIGHENGDGNVYDNNLSFTTGYGINQSSSKPHTHHHSRSQQRAMTPPTSLSQQQTVSNGSNNMNPALLQHHSQPKLSVAGPITDL